MLMITKKRLENYLNKMLKDSKLIQGNLWIANLMSWTDMFSIWWLIMQNYLMRNKVITWDIMDGKMEDGNWKR